MPIADPADLTTKYGVRDVVACGVGYTFVEANQDSTVEANDVQQGVENYSIGNDPSKWARECKTYGFVTHKNVYDGIDIKYYERDEKLEYDVILKEGADLDQVRIQCSGLKNMRIDESGALVGETPFGELRQEKPVAFVEDVTGRKRNINCRFQLTGQDCYGFVADDVRHGDRLTVDPGLLIFGKFLGGTGIDKAHGIAVEANGNSYVTGETASINFPMQGGLGFPVSDNTYNTNTDFFISKINALGRALIYSTYWVFRNLCG
ncbi:MAG: SBBP repeat-containing protein [Planctomycetota bacterium]